MKIIKDIDLKVPQHIGKDFLNKMMGGHLNPKIEEMLESARIQCINNIEPRGCYDILDISGIRGEQVSFKSGNIFRGPNISEILKGSESALIFIITLGSKIDGLIQKQRDEGDNLYAIVLDSVSTSLLTLLGDYFGRMVKKEARIKEGWQATCSYSPGQYKWTIEEQKEIFRIVDGKSIGVSLNSSFLMVPFKSVSGVYGFGPAHKISKTKVACELCPRDNCIGRRN